MEFKEILQKEDDLQEIVQLVGKDSLQQNGFSDYDFFCPLAKTIGMMKVIVAFHESSQKAMAEFTGDQKLTWNTISVAMKDLVKEITDMKFDMPRQSDDHFKQTLNVKLYEKVVAAFRNLAEDK